MIEVKPDMTEPESQEWLQYVENQARALSKASPDRPGAQSYASLAHTAETVRIEVQTRS